jgi:hypothetical protein
MKFFMAVLALVIAADAQAWGCAYEKKLEQSLDVSGSDLLAVAAGAGDLEISGVGGSSEVVIRGTVCVSDEDWLDQVRIDAVPGERAQVNVSLPDLGSGWSLWGSRYAYVDVVLEVPRDLALEVRDSSGDIEMRDIAAVSVRDSSGDIDIRGAAGPVQIQDSSGDIEVADLEQGLTIVSDSSGDIRGNDIGGDVRVVADSSGDIRFSGVGQDVIVEKDSSGDISARDVGGDFQVLKDSSGEISSSEVRGEVLIPEHKTR